MKNLFISNFKNLLLALTGCIMCILYVLVLDTALKKDEISYATQFAADVQTLKELQHLDLLIIGGSNTAFSVSAESIESASGLKSMNLGRHASIDLHLYLSLVTSLLDDANIAPIILVAPEYYAFKNSHSFDPINCFLNPYLNFTHWLKYACIFHNTKSVLKILFRGSIQSDTQFYSRLYFSDHGDYLFPDNFPVKSVVLDEPGFLHGIEVYRKSALMNNLRSISKNIYFIPVVIPNHHCEKNQITEDIIKSFFKEINGSKNQFDMFTICADDSFFLDTSYHTNNELRVIRTAEILAFLEQLEIQ